MRSRMSDFVSSAGRYLLAGGGAVLLAVLAGCVDKRVNFENYERIQVGMPMEEVEDVVGKPARRHGHDYYYEGQYGWIKVEAKKDRVHEKKWEDKKH